MGCYRESEHIVDDVKAGTMDDSGQVIVFCLVAFCVTYLLEAWLWLSGGLAVWFAFAVLIAVMFVPMLSAAMTVKLVEHGSLRSHGIAKGRVEHYLCGLAYPFGVIALGLVFVAVLRTAPIDLTMTKFKEIFPNVPAATEIPLYFTVINLILAPFINFIPALGEEYGWRGFLLPKLVGRFNLLGGLVLTGTAWGIWHAPLILMGYNYPHHPDLVGVAAFTVWCILVGFFLGWLRLKSKSVLPAALGHGAINAYVGFGLLIAPAADEMMTIPLGLPAMLALLVFAAVAYVDLSESLARLATSPLPPQEQIVRVSLGAHATRR